MNRYKISRGDVEFEVLAVRASIGDEDMLFLYDEDGLVFATKCWDTVQKVPESPKGGES